MNRDNFTPFTPENTQGLLSKYINNFSRPLPNNWFLNPINLYNGSYKYFESDDCLTIFKDKLMYGKPVTYLVGAPYHYTGDKETELCLLKHIASGYDIALPDYELQYYGIKSSSEKPYWEFIYKASDYTEDMGGKKNKMWRKSINHMVDAQIKVSFFTGALPFLASNNINQLMSEWKSERKKQGVANHSRWYLPSINQTKAKLVILYKLGNKPIAYDYSVLVGNTVYFLDGKISRHESVPDDLDRAFHITAINEWAKILGHRDFFINTGLGDKPYTQDGKVYDLDQHKKLLRPHIISNYNKIRKGDLCLTQIN